jgi:hypothetical protein
MSSVFLTVVVKYEIGEMFPLVCPLFICRHVWTYLRGPMYTRLAGVNIAGIMAAS